jgi:hypothetical protein
MQSVFRPGGRFGSDLCVVARGDGLRRVHALSLGFVLESSMAYGNSLIFVHKVSASLVLGGITSWGDRSVCVYKASLRFVLGGITACSNNLVYVHEPDDEFVDRLYPLAEFIGQDTSAARRSNLVAFDLSSLAGQACTRTFIVDHCALIGNDRGASDLSGSRPCQCTGTSLHAHKTMVHRKVDRTEECDRR